MIIIDKRFKGIRPIMICFAAWVGLCSLVLLLLMDFSYLLGFLLGVAGSLVYIFLLCRRVVFMLEDSAAPIEHQSYRVGWRKWLPLPKDILNRLWRSWRKTLQPIVCIFLIILGISQVAQLSFLTAIIGLISFQVSIFLYLAVLSFARFLE